MNAALSIFLTLLIFLAGGESEAVVSSSKERLSSTPLGFATTLSAYDPLGHRTQISELSGRTIQNTFDALHRLTAESISRSVGVPPTSSHEALGTLSYAYDLVGNRQSRTVTGNATLFGVSARINIKEAICESVYSDPTEYPPMAAGRENSA